MTSGCNGRTCSGDSLATRPKFDIAEALPFFIVPFCDGFLEVLLSKVLMNRRHICGAGGSLSVWITTQVYNKIPAPIRKCASQLVLYESKNRMELDALYNEVIVGLSKMEWYQLCKYIWDKKFNFMYIDTTKHFNSMYHKNFNCLQLVTSMDEKMGEF